MADLFAGVIRHIIQTAYANREGMGDYRGPDGLMHCGRCHAPVESRMDGIPGFSVVPIMCPCQDQQKREETDEESIMRLVREAREKRDTA